ncbi:HlyD family efflux transporter periplasmic adaptor subunit [Bradyrhizobium sp. LHD-71]|uniref:efflux RND transporter periplasmic adaptor subunit n=1 Tax=Bradyrhizobium sp. LHD-71 TaxID=3072141 RepID=UPI00281039E5|nr:HlyD family efflux transporter periplasmic adaptor subunit [Bradyrhizobium sp. LHD-71]MDQ8727128.1 efflux RND transporter periplasmic adaptor subunit [Bradyrhizobium sp. LHD-71]
MLMTGREWMSRGQCARAAVLAAACVLLPEMALAQDSPKGVTVTVVKAAKACFAATAEVFGVLLPVEEVAVTPPREGLRISQVLVDPGATVTSGQALVRLAPPDGAEVTLVAPAAGTVSNVSAVVGTMASARAEPLFRIIARGEFEMVGDVPAKDMPALAVGQAATIRVVGAPSVQGQVRSVSSTIDPVRQVGQVRIQVTTPKPRLLVNASGRATIKTGESCNVAVPLTAILYGNGGAVIQVVRRQRVETRQVEVGLTSARQAEIKEGLAEGDVVVARAGALLREGDPVRTVNIDDTPTK